VRISRDPRNGPLDPALAIRFAAIPVVLLSVHGASVATVSSPSPAARATSPTAQATPASPKAKVKAKAAPPTAKAKSASPTATARLPRVPGLRISITDGRTTVQAGDRLTYTVLVQNTGARRSPPLKITQTLPPGLRFVSASRHGVARAGSVTWHADPAAGRKDTFSLQAQVTRSAVRQSRLAAVACATLAGSRTPIVCAAHLDRLPGAPAAASGRRAATAAASTLPSYAVGALAVLAAGVLAIVAGRRVRVRVRRRRAG
jgi:uncharacterized repeat protein (TIGR01451 family)